MRRARVLLWALIVLLAILPPAAQAQTPAGQMTWAVHTTLVPAWLDPADNIQGTPFMIQMATHDALVKPMPGRSMAPSLAESWSVSPDGLVYEFVLRKGVKFHNGEPVTAEDVKFTFERYRGVHAKTLKERVAAIEIPDPGRVRFRLKQAWPDFMTFYGTRTTSAGWIVPKKYVEKVGNDGYRKAPIGAGPYRFVSFTPGVELVLEAFEGYWRKVPHVKRLVLRVIPDHATRLAALKRGDVDIVYLISGELAGEVQRTPGLTLKAVFPSNQQAVELDRAKREAILHRIQQLIHERAMFAPIWDFAFLHGVGPRVEESGLGLLEPHGFSGPYEDVKLKGK